MNTKAQISDIDLTPDVDLTESRLDILPYKGIMDCNSPHVGGVLNNVYKKEIPKGDGRKLVCVHNGDVWSVKQNSDYFDLYKGNTVKASFLAFTVTKNNKGKEVSFYSAAYPFSVDTTLVTIKILSSQLFVSANGKIKKITLPSWSYAFHICYGTYNNEYCLIVVFAPSEFIETSKAQFVQAYIPLTPGSSSNYAIDTDPQTIYYYKNSDKEYNASTVSRADLNLCKWCQYAGTELKVETPDPTGLPLNSIECPPVNYNVLTDGTYNHRGERSGSLVLYNKQPFALSGGQSIVSYEVDFLVSNVYLSSNSLTAGALIIKDNNFIIYEYGYNYSWDENFISAKNGLITTKFVLTNAYDLKKEKAIRTSLAYFDEMLFKYEKTGTEKINDFTLMNVATGYNEQVQVMGEERSIVPILPETQIYWPSNLNISYENVVWFNEEYLPSINVYVAKVSEGAAKYYSTLYFNSAGVFANSVIQSNYVGYLYPVQADGNTLLPVALNEEISFLQNNQALVTSGDTKYLAAHDSYKNIIFAYYLYNQGQLDNLFLIQTGFYGINGDYIYPITIINEVMSVGDAILWVGDLKYLGAFPLMALFWSELDKSIYVFTGDNNLKKLKEAYRINTIGAIYCDPARLTMFISTDIGLIVLYQEQVFLLDYPLIESSEKIYYDNEKYVVGDNLLSFSFFAGSESQAIKIKTEFYGESRMIKSVNDCVFVRITKNDSITSGTVKIKAYTLTEKTSESTEQIYSISEKNFDTSGQCLLQYQPQFQTGVGFAAELESDFPIAYMGISHQPEAIQQAPKGKQNVIATPVSKPNSSTFKFE